MKENIGTLLLAVFAGSSLVFGIMQHLFKINILKIIILLGTASLAMAFAGNDLVNFIGVPMAGLNSYQIASEAHANGIDVGLLAMDKLKEPVIADWRYLVCGGLIMTMALWFSKKARGVTDTGVNLSRQDEGIERFGSSQTSRALVRIAVNYGKALDRILPDSVLRFIDSRFKPLAPTSGEKASFDLIRASVCLTVASLIISLGTSLKLPLSTTYVTFMVAMGASLADRAWGRESAVYRISGVLTVVTGWFLTALAAFIMSGSIACLLMFVTGISNTLRLVTVVLFGLTAYYFLYRSSGIGGKKKEKIEDEIEELDGDMAILEYGYKDIKKSIKKTNNIYSRTFDALFTENRNELKGLVEEAHKMYKKAKNKQKYEVLPNLKRFTSSNLDVSCYYVQVVDYNYEISKSLVHITRECFEYIDNSHDSFSEEQIQDLKGILDTVNDIYNEFLTMLDTGDYTDFEDLMKKRETLIEVYAQSTKKQIKRIKENQSGTRNSILFLFIMTETKALVLQSRNLMRSQRKISKLDLSSIT